MKINKTWHSANKMPENAGLDQRIEWHLAHQQHCACRKIPSKLMAEIKKRSLKK